METTPGRLGGESDPQAVKPSIGLCRHRAAANRCFILPPCPDGSIEGRRYVGGESKGVVVLRGTHRRAFGVWTVKVRVNSFDASEQMTGQTRNRKLREDAYLTPMFSHFGASENTCRASRSFQEGRTNSIHLSMFAGGPPGEADWL